MPKRMHERYDVESIRFARGEHRSWPNTGEVPLSDFLDAVAEPGSVYRLLGDAPDDTGLQLTILVDGKTVVSFELPWIVERSWFGRRKHTYLAGGPPYEIGVRAVSDCRRKIGQRKGRIFLDHAMADAHRLVGQGNTRPE